MKLFRSPEQLQRDSEGNQMFNSINKTKSFLGALSCAINTEVGYAEGYAPNSTRLVKSTVTVDEQPIPITQEVHVTSNEKASA